MAVKQTRTTAKYRLIAAFGMMAAVLMQPVLAGAADSQPISLTMDKAQILHFNKAIKSVIIGNEQIADAVLKDGQTLVLTGRRNGVTNIVVMDAQGQRLLDEEIMVGQNDQSTLRIFRGTAVQVMNCTPNCAVKPAN